MRERPVHESRTLSLMAGPGLGKGLLQLAPRCGESNAHSISCSLQAVTIGDRYRRLCFTIGEVKGSP